MSAPPPPAPVRLVGRVLILFGLAITAIPLSRLSDLPAWIWLAFGLAALLVGLGVWGLRARRWIEPMFAALYVMAFALIAVGPMTDLDIYPTTGILCLTILSVGAAILHRLGPRAD